MKDVKRQRKYCRGEKNYGAHNGTIAFFFLDFLNCLIFFSDLTTSLSRADSRLWFVINEHVYSAERRRFNAAAHTNM
jgi:hypothetical protein